MSKRLAKACEALLMAASGIWCGAMIMLVLSAVTLFQTMREVAPSLPHGLHGVVVSDAEAAHALAGEVVGRIILRLNTLEVICLLLMVAALLIQASLTRLGRRDGQPWRCWSRIGLLTAIVLVSFYSWFVVQPQVLHERAIMQDQQLAMDQRDQAQIRFQQQHRRSEQLGTATVVLLAGMLASPLLSTGRPRTQEER